MKFNTNLLDRVREGDSIEVIDVEEFAKDRDICGNSILSQQWALMAVKKLKIIKTSKKWTVI